MSRETEAPFSLFVPSLLQVTLVRNRATHKQSYLWHQWGYRQYKSQLHWHFYPHTRLLSAARSFYLHNTSSQLRKAYEFGISHPHPTPTPDFAFLFCAYHNPVLLEVSPSGYKIIDACIKKNWVSGAANNQKHPRDPTLPGKVLPAEFLGVLTFRGCRGSLHSSAAAPGLWGCSATTVSWHEWQLTSM